MFPHFSCAPQQRKYLSSIFGPRSEKRNLEDSAHLKASVTVAAKLTEEKKNLKGKMEMWHKTLGKVEIVHKLSKKGVSISFNKKGVFYFNRGDFLYRITFSISKDFLSLSPDLHQDSI